MPSSFKKWSIWPLHLSLPTPLIPDPLPLIIRLLEVHDGLIILVEFHGAEARPLSILEQPLVEVAIDKLDSAVAREPTILELSVQVSALGVGVLLGLEQVAEGVLVLARGYLVIAELTHDVWAIWICYLSLSLLYIINPLPSVLGPSLSPQVLAPSPLDAHLVISCVHVSIRVLYLADSVTQYSIRKLADNLQTVCELNEAISMELVLAELAFVSNGPDLGDVSQTWNVFFEAWVE